VLSVVTIIDLALSFIEIAYLGTNEVAGEASPLNLFGGIRHLDADWLIAEALLAVLAVSALVLVLRRRA